MNEKNCKHVFVSFKIFTTILQSKDKKGLLRKAKELLERIVKRNLYKRLGRVIRPLKEGKKPNENEIKKSVVSDVNYILCKKSFLKKKALIQF